RAVPPRGKRRLPEAAYITDDAGEWDDCRPGLGPGGPAPGETPTPRGGLHNRLKPDDAGDWDDCN
ncbi:MAG: hypothetical protein NTV79_08765, partial [Candidatus Aureabacteria bacterium]|nr:hypothetical protein [Candidatus Auribacterota bacterium]